MMLDKLKLKIKTTHDPYDCGDIQFIWGVKSSDDVSSGPANLYTMNDIDITYSKKTHLYSLGVETVYLFMDGKQGEVKYLNELLKKFTQFMIDNNYDINDPYNLRMDQPHVNMFAESIPELYTQFRIFVEGFKAVYGEKEEETPK